MLMCKYGFRKIVDSRNDEQSSINYPKVFLIENKKIIVSILRNSILFVKDIFFKFFQLQWRPTDVITRSLRRNVEVLRGLFS
ncbi:hypothetical protein CDAR_196901 [Caerostris darwini]|uniref:Uncharacterized protein n=1 Tax=Caerostris darwini TaxID=1538125 RepID=A0AAV4PZF6_9ARAC|nr:hypothetical protein CDAR_196901 [Caerostris darwini]